MKVELQVITPLFYQFILNTFIVNYLKPNLLLVFSFQTYHYLINLVFNIHYPFHQIKDMTFIHILIILIIINFIHYYLFTYLINSYLDFNYFNYFIIKKYHLQHLYCSFSSFHFINVSFHPQFIIKLIFFLITYLIYFKLIIFIYLFLTFLFLLLILQFQFIMPIFVIIILLIHFLYLIFH